MKDLHLKILALSLLVIGGVLAYYKVVYLELPLLPSGETQVWTVEARIAFAAKGGPAKVQFYIPRRPPGWLILGEDFVSSNYGLAAEDDGVNREVNWAVRRARAPRSPRSCRE